MVHEGWFPAYAGMTVLVLEGSSENLQIYVVAYLENEPLAIRKIPGFHDEPLKGNRKGQRSIRLSKAYRAIYIIGQQGNIEIAEIIEVNKHDY